MIEFEDPDHERILREIAQRLGFDLVSARLELFGRRIETHATPRQPGLRVKAAHSTDQESSALRQRDVAR